MRAAAGARGAALGLALAALWAPALGAQTTEPATRYLAFGDSITFGEGDDPDRPDPGYPARLETLLNERGTPALVAKSAVPGETTAEGLSRIDPVLAEGPDVLLLMEGTNDVARNLSLETTLFNLREMARRAENRGIRAVLATTLPIAPAANTDPNNRRTRELAVLVRGEAAASGRDLVDIFEEFIAIPDVFEELYADNFHTNAAGYDIMARAFADVLTGVDSVPPVTGDVRPADGATGVAAGSAITVELFDFGAGIDPASLTLLVGGTAVNPVVEGDGLRLDLTYQPPQPLAGIVTVELRARDLASPPNTMERQLARFTIAGTTFLTGDLDLDGRVDGADLVAFAIRFGALRGEPRYRRVADFNNDGRIDGLDLAALANNFGMASF